MNRKRDSATPSMPSHDKPVDDNDMKPSLGPDIPEAEQIEDEGEPFGENFA
jgi:hypothetical protein